MSGRDAIGPVFALQPTARMEVVGKLQGKELALTHGRRRIVLDDPMTPA